MWSFFSKTLDADEAVVEYDNSDTESVTTDPEAKALFGAISEQEANHPSVSWHMSLELRPTGAGAHSTSDSLPGSEQGTAAPFSFAMPLRLGAVPRTEVKWLECKSLQLTSLL